MDEKIAAPQGDETLVVELLDRERFITEGPRYLMQLNARAAALIRSQAAEIAGLKEWKEAIIGLCKAIGSDDMHWGGDKTGWGFIHFFVKHLHTRAEAAESRLASAMEALNDERNVIAAEGRRYAGFYPEASDGRNTFIIFAEWVEDRTALSSLKGGANE